MQDLDGDFESFKSPATLEAGCKGVG